MQENIEYIQKGFRVLLPSMAGYIGQEMSRVYKNKWWDEVLYVLSDQKDLPYSGDYGKLVDSLDIANCIRLIEREWKGIFRDRLPQLGYAWSKELMAIRNIVSHIGVQDVDQLVAERALDTMVLLSEKIDSETASEIRELYNELRAKAEQKPVEFVYSGLEQPISDSKRGSLTEGSILNLVGTDEVEKTTMTRKVTYGGKTVVYPVYRVRLDKLYYNDQNDRIATWISRYEAENGNDSLKGLNIEIYNRIIENFIYESNPEATQKTQNNIQLVGQRESGVTLADGRIVDGNRRYTCLRRLQKETPNPLYFETVIMDMDVQEDKKQIKLLELAIQHGEEKKVDYDVIEYAIGTYRDIELTKLLTVEEYAQSTNEPVTDVRKRIEIARTIGEFLKYVKLPEQYHIAKEYQVYDLLSEMLPALRVLDGKEKEELKSIVFANILMKSISDQRKFIRNIRNLVRSDTYNEYFNEQKDIIEKLNDKFSLCAVKSKEELERFAFENSLITEKLQISLEKALLKSRNQLIKVKPSENVSKSISLLMDIDSRLFDRLSMEEKENLVSGFDQLETIIQNFKKLL